MPAPAPKVALVARFAISNERAANGTGIKHEELRLYCIATSPGDAAANLMLSSVCPDDAGAFDFQRSEAGKNSAARARARIASDLYVVQSQQSNICISSCIGTVIAYGATVQEDAIITLARHRFEKSDW